MKYLFLAFFTGILIGCSEQPEIDKGNNEDSSLEIVQEMNYNFSQMDKAIFDSLLKSRGYRFYEKTIYEYDTIIRECPSRSFIQKRIGEFDDVGSFHPHIKAVPCYAYASPNENSEIIDTLESGTNCGILDQVGSFYLICDQNGSAHYVRREDIGLYLIGDYSISTTQYSSTDEHRPGGCLNTEVTIYNNRPESNYSLILSLPTDFYQVYEIDGSGIEGNRSVFKIKDHCYSGLGTDVVYYIFEADDGHLEVLKTSGSGDGGASDHQDVFLPLQHVNGGPTVFVAGGEFSLNEYDGSLNILTYPEELSIPKSQLIIVRNYSVDYDHEMNESEVFSEEFIYYQWNGRLLKRIEE